MTSSSSIPIWELEKTTRCMEGVVRSTDSDTQAIPSYFRLQRVFFHCNTPYILLAILRVEHTIERALRSTVATRAQHPLLRLCSKGIPMRTRTLALAQMWIYTVAAGMVVITGSLRQIISKRGYSTWYAPDQSLERHHTREMLSRI